MCLGGKTVHHCNMFTQCWFYVNIHLEFYKNEICHSVHSNSGDEFKLIWAYSSIWDILIWRLTTGSVWVRKHISLLMFKNKTKLPHSLPRRVPWHLLHNTFVNLAVFCAHLCSSEAYISSAYATGWQMRERITREN